MSRLFVSSAPLPSPSELRRELPLSPALERRVSSFRKQMVQILLHTDPRLAIVAGPCSVHHPPSAIEYAHQLRELASDVSGQCLLLMRLHGEKPRTTVGWKGLIMDPNIDGTDEIATGLRRMRQLLLKVTDLGVPITTEFLDPLIAPYISDLVTWGQIGARTSNSQIHRQLASSLSLPIGFKNPVDGNIKIAVEGALSAQHPHTWIGQDDGGALHALRSPGNPNTHIVLRGGAGEPNYTLPYLNEAVTLLNNAELPPTLFIDCSHDNSRKNHLEQASVFRDVIRNACLPSSPVRGILLESYLQAGKQEDPLLTPYIHPEVSVTDPCLDWETTDQLIREAHGELEAAKGASICVLSG